MKAESLERNKEPFAARRVRIKGKRKVVLDEADYEALLGRADLWEPDLPAADANGNYPALEALAVIQARNILRARRKLGLSQVELARRAGIRPETLNRIEHGRNKPSVPTIAKLDRALKAGEAKAGRGKGKATKVK
ncbi:MAG TPA: helix-turn-helix transcriptional regulator [Pirellulales bacterium]|nr:helix-turn-helix transcriptional regulator [Pirellulales bacterium]